MAGGWVYFMANKRDGTLYVGVTSNMPKRRL
jgi:predicted GIY-YIG superfamily endonuclease